MDHSFGVIALMYLFFLCLLPIFKSIALQILVKYCSSQALLRLQLGAAFEVKPGRKLELFFWWCCSRPQVYKLLCNDRSRHTTKFFSSVLLSRRQKNLVFLHISPIGTILKSPNHFSKFLFSKRWHEQKSAPIKMGWSKSKNTKIAWNPINFEIKILWRKLDLLYVIDSSLKLIIWRLIKWQNKVLLL